MTFARLADALGQWKPEAGGFDEPIALLAAAWPELVGQEVAAHSHPLRIEAGTLLVTTTSSAWSQQLSLLGTQIIASLRARMPKAGIEQLRFRIGRIPRRGGSPGRPARPQAGRAGSADPRPPSAHAQEALARFATAVEERRRAKSAAGWKECEGCGALVAPGGAALCVTCHNARSQDRETAVARLLFEAPWLGFRGIATLVDGLDQAEYESIRRAMLARWWEALSRAAASKRLSRDHRERLIASSYVVLKSGLPPESISSVTVLNVLGSDLCDLLYGTEQ